MGCVNRHKATNKQEGGMDDANVGKEEQRKMTVRIYTHSTFSAGTKSPLQQNENMP